MFQFVKPLSRALVLFFAGALLATSAAAVEHIKLADGTVLDGDAIDYNEATQTLTFRLHTGRDVKYTIDQLDQRSVYSATHGKVEKDNAQGQIKVGNYARDIGLYAHAARHYRYALAADPSVQAQVDEEVVKLKTVAATWGMEHAKKAIERNDLREAEKWLKKLVDKVPDTPEGKEAQGMLDRYYARKMAPQTAATTAAGTGSPADLLETDLKKGKEYYDSMVEKTKAGLREDRTGSKAIPQWEGAVKEGEKALKELDKVDKKYTDAATVEFLKECRKAVNDQIIENRLNLASLYMTRTSYNKAMSETNQALALDPKNAGALAMRSRIENAAGCGWRWC